MALSKFSVVDDPQHASTTIGNPIVHCYDSEKLIIAIVERAALMDYFRIPGGVSQSNEQQPPRPTVKDWSLLVKQNLDAFAQIISSKWGRGKHDTFTYAGISYPRVVVTLSDMQDSGLPLTLGEMEEVFRPERSTHSGLK